MRLVLKIKNIASFTKTRFYLKGGCTKIRKHAKTFRAIKGYKMANIFYTSFTIFKKEIQGAVSKRYLHEYVALQTPTFYIPYFQTSLHRVD